MEQARVNWNDNRLDHLSGQVDDLRRHVDERFDAQAVRIEERFENQDARIEARFDRLQNAMIVTLGGILAAFGSAVLAVAL
jgi:hypothetical protein